MAGTLVATRYVPPGSYIGQLITPGQVSAEARLPCYIGRGSRLALGRNIPITRSYIFAQSLTFSPTAPFVANLTYDGDGDQQAARLFKADGTEVRRDQWSFQDTGSGTNNQVLINTEVYDSTATYSLDYQSTSRVVTDTVPVEDLREIVSLGNQVDKPQYLEYDHFYIETAVTNSTADSGNANPSPSFSAIAVDGGNTGGSDPTFASAAAYAHNYTRSYHVEVLTNTVGVKATGSITCVGGADLIDGKTVVLSDGINPATTFEFNTGAASGSNVLVSYAGGDAAGAVASALQTAINGVGSTLLLTSSAPAGAVLTITADNFGAAANQSITDTVADGGFTTTGMASGADRVVSCEWNAQAVSPGNNAGYDAPLHSSATKPTFTVTDASAGSFTPLLEYGVELEFDFGATDTAPFAVGDGWSFTGNGPSLIEGDVRHGNSNQFAEIDDPIADAGNTGATGTGLALDTTAAFTGTYNASYRLEVTAAVGTVSGTRTTTFIWGEAGDHVGINGTFAVDEATPASLTQTLSKGVVIDIVYPAANNFAVGDVFTIAARAPQQVYQSKDSRTYTFTTSVATNASAGEGFVSGTYVTDTPEGGFGTFEATGNDKLTSDPDYEDGHFMLPNNVWLAARNLFFDALTAGNQHAATDVNTLAATQAGTINWTLAARTNETVEADGIVLDVNGAVTGTANTPYLILSQTPTQVNSVVTNVGATPVTYTHITGTPYVTFLTDPGEALIVNYDWRSAEPDPGQTYYLTAKFLRPTESYNTPTLILDRQDGRNALAPATVDNHLYVMNELAWDNGAPGLYFVQVQDPDDDGVYTDADFNEAIIASEAPRRITDIIVLSQWSSLGNALNSVNRMNDPFERRERLCWVGAPTGTQIGDAQTPDTIIYAARNTLQVYGNNPAHGTRILVGSTQATKEIRLDDGTTVTTMLDGSFVAGALAALVASFQSPGETILRKTLGGFNTLETYGDIEDPRNLALGAAQVVAFTDQGGGVFRIEEDVTTDSFADDFKNINAMTQKQFVTKNVRAQTDAALTGVVVPSAQAGVGLVKGFVVGAVSTLVSRGVVARFQDDDGNERPINPDTDVVVFRDETDTTLYHFFYAYWLLTVIKRQFGLYSTNSNDFGLLRG